MENGRENGFLCGEIPFPGRFLSCVIGNCVPYAGNVSKSLRRDVSSQRKMAAGAAALRRDLSLLLFQSGQAPSLFLLAFDGSEGAVLVGGEDVVLF